eukprot:gene43870-58477_t
MAEFWKPVIDRGGDGHPIVVYQHNKHLSIPQQRRSLPIWQYRDQILYALESYKTVVLVGETGSGKTTQIPQYLHEFGWTAGGRCVVCTQPRRMAAISVATRVAEEMGVNLGNEVGYAVRFDSKWRLYPVDVQYLIEPVANYLRAAVDTVLQIHQSESAGDVLVFLPGGEDIDNAIEMMKERHD